MNGNPSFPINLLSEQMFLPKSSIFFVMQYPSRIDWIASTLNFRHKCFHSTFSKTESEEWEPFIYYDQLQTLPNSFQASIFRVFSKRFFSSPRKPFHKVLIDLAVNNFNGGGLPNDQSFFYCHRKKNILFAQPRRLSSTATMQIKSILQLSETNA
jgi:hypothetical protein